MSAPTIASPANARALLSAFGENVSLEDGSTIQAIVRREQSVTYNGVEAVRKIHTVLHVPAVFQGSFAQSQFVTVRGQRAYVPALVERGSGWVSAALSASPP